MGLLGQLSQIWSKEVDKWIYALLHFPLLNFWANFLQSKPIINFHPCSSPKKNAITKIKQTCGVFSLLPLFIPFGMMHKFSESPDLQSSPSLLLWDFLPDLGDFQLLQLDPTEGDPVGSAKKYGAYCISKEDVYGHTSCIMYFWEMFYILYKLRTRHILYTRVPLTGWNRPMYDENLYHSDSQNKPCNHWTTPVLSFHPLRTCMQHWHIHLILYMMVCLVHRMIALYIIVLCTIFLDAHCCTYCKKRWPAIWLHRTRATDSLHI